MTNYDMLYQLDISSFYFYKPFAVPDFCLLEIYKKLGLPLSAINLQSTVTQITISINIFTCFKYDTIESQFLY